MWGVEGEDLSKEKIQGRKDRKEAQAPGNDKLIKGNGKRWDEKMQRRCFGEGGKAVTVKQRDKFVEDEYQQGDRHLKGIISESHE